MTDQGGNGGDDPSFPCTREQVDSARLALKVVTLERENMELRAEYQQEYGEIKALIRSLTTEFSQFRTDIVTNLNELRADCAVHADKTEADIAALAELVQP